MNPGRQLASVSTSYSPQPRSSRDSAKFRTKGQKHFCIALLCNARGQPCSRAATIRLTPELCHQRQERQRQRCCIRTAASQITCNPAVGELAEGLETPVQAVYLITLLGFLVVGAYLVVRQVLIRRELEEAAKVLGDRIRTDNASSEDFFELGVILLRKKLFTSAVKNLEKARKKWDGEPDELAQVHNALGYAYFNMEKASLAVENYRKAVELQPGYVTAWNNLGDACEKVRDWKSAYEAYTEALSYAPDNRIARERSDSLRSKVQQASR